MRKLKNLWAVHYALRSLLIVAGVFLLLAAFAPKANATLLVYFNFEDAVTGGSPDFVADTIAGGNPGGGIQASTMTTNFPAGQFDSGPGLLLNRSAGDIDTANPGQALRLQQNPATQGRWIQFSVNATAFSNMSLSFATTAGNSNGFTLVALSYSTNGGATFTAAGSVALTQSLQLVTFTVPAGANNQAALVLRLTFSGTSSTDPGVTTIDNIQLNGTAVPEPATVAGGLLGVLGLCFHQRRRLKLLLPGSRRASL